MLQARPQKATVVATSGPTRLSSPVERVLLASATSQNRETNLAQHLLIRLVSTCRVLATDLAMLRRCGRLAGTTVERGLDPVAQGGGDHVATHVAHAGACSVCTRLAETRPASTATAPRRGLEDRSMLTLLGQQLFPADNPWNQNIANAPVAANSAAVISNIGASIRVHPDWGDDNPANGTAPLYGIPVNIVHGNGMHEGQRSDRQLSRRERYHRRPDPGGAVLEGDYQNGPNLNGGGYGENGNPNQRGDSHLIVWDEDNNIAYELYGVSRPNDPTLFPDNDDVEAPKTDSALARGPGNRLGHEDRQLPHARGHVGRRGWTVDPGRPGAARRGTDRRARRTGSDHPRAPLHAARPRRQSAIHLSRLAHGRAKRRARTICRSAADCASRIPPRST